LNINSLWNCDKQAVCGRNCLPKSRYIYQAPPLVFNDLRHL